MSVKSNVSFSTWRALLFAVALALVGCGDDEDGINTLPAIFPLLIDIEEAPRVLFFSYQANDLLLAREPREADLRAYVQGSHAPCVSGRVSVEFDDKDRNGSLSTGDEARVHFDDCTYRSATGLGDRYVDGTLAFDEVVVSGSIDRWHAFTLGRPTYSDSASRARAPTALFLDYRVEIERGHGLSIARSTILDDRMQVTKTLDGEGVAMSGRSQSRSTFTPGPDDDFETSYSLNFYTRIASVDQTPGFFATDTLEPLRGRVSENGGYPSTGAIRLIGEGRDPLNRLAPITAMLIAEGTDGSVRIEVDEGADGTINLSRRTTWAELATLE